MPLFAVCAPVAVFVPGALITNALLELTAADIVTGLAAGIAAGSALTGLRVDPASAALVGEVAGVGTDRGGWEAVPSYWVSWVAVVGLAVGLGLVFRSGWRLTRRRCGEASSRRERRRPCCSSRPDCSSGSCP
ncbi:hypothetical protein [Curtobacterium sp. Csp1]|uniref:hypothetical protein n=1 Tax=Curtobacterium sp. Csp1 TaxID=2495429 RepID=UPI001C2ECC96|nr:hypothetical protein [Curtobacterium sp. Csp1]